MTTSELTQTYGRALFDLANAVDAVNAVDEGLRAIATTVADSVDLREALSDSNVTNEAKRAITSELFAGYAPEAVAICTLVVERRGPEALFALQKEYAQIAEKENGLVVAEVVTAIELDDATRTSLEKKLAAAMDRPVTLRESVDPMIIGGIRISIGDRVLDGTLSTQLDAVRSTLSNASQGGEV